jgi:hypothetical protein
MMVPAVKEEYEWILENPNFDIEGFLNIKNRRELETKISPDLLDLKLKNRAKSYVKDQIRRARGGEVVELNNLIRSTTAISLPPNIEAAKECKQRIHKGSMNTNRVSPRLKGRHFGTPTKSPVLTGRSP